MALYHFCPCMSDMLQHQLKDARGIFVAYVCPACEEGVKATYRPEIFTDPNYDAPDLGDDGEL